MERPGLLGYHQQQATELPPACAHPAEEHRTGRHRRAGQRACSRAGPGRRCAAACWPSATPTPCCGCPPASSTPKASRPTCCSLTASRPARHPGRRDLWIYDLRTNRRFTLKTNPLTPADLNDFVCLLQPGQPSGSARRRNASAASPTTICQARQGQPDIFWLRDESMEDSASLPPPDEIAEEIVEDLRAALEQLEEIAADLSSHPGIPQSFRRKPEST